MRAGVKVGLLSLCALAPISIGAPAWAIAAVAPPSKWGASAAAPAPHVPGELLVRFRGGMTATSRSRAVSAEGAAVARHLDHAVPGLELVKTASGESVAQAEARFEARGDVVYAEPNYLVGSLSTTPNDSRFGELWGLHNTGQAVGGGAPGTTDADIDAPEAWDLTTGSASVVVAVVDTGVAYDHPDLAPNVWVNSDEIAGNGVDDDNNGFVDDRRGWDFFSNDNDPRDEAGHGTHVAGTIGARGNNDSAGAGPTDVTGVAWQVALMPVRVLGPDGFGSVASIVQAIDYAVANGARVVSMSLGGYGTSQAEIDAVNAAPNVLFVAAAGNDGVNVDTNAFSPCTIASPNVVCVAATDPNDALASFSNYGASSVDVAAPGVAVLSTSPYRTVFSDDFSVSLAGRWTTGGTPNTWGRSTELFGGTDFSLTDSPNANYANNQDNWARLTNPLDLSGLVDCNVLTGHYVNSQAGVDVLSLQTATSTSGPWTTIASWSGQDIDFNRIRAAGFDGQATAYLRARFTSNASVTGFGGVLDDMSIECATPNSYSAANFRYLDGTSMATPHVSGVAALVLSRFPNITTAQLKAKLLASIDAKQSLAGKTVTGGRINAFKAVTNAPPVARAGNDKSVNKSTSFTLDASTSSDPENAPLSFTWSQIGGPVVTINDKNSAVANVTAPSSATTLTFRVTVSDGQGGSGTDDIVVTVKNPK
jgi:subtilisin family serine protease